MGRPKRLTVDYFPHYVKWGKTLYILESKYKNDGYAFWFKLLQILGDTEGHYFRAGNTADWNFLLAKTMVNEEIAFEILNLLADLDAIDKQLWAEAKIIWSQNFVDGLTEVYRKRCISIPKRPNIGDGNDSSGLVSGAEMPQSIVEESIVEESIKKKELNKKEKQKLSKKLIPLFEIFWEAYPRKEGRGLAAEAFGKVKPDKALVDIMVASLEKQKKSIQWVKEDGQFIPLPSTWLNQSRWLDDLKQIKQGVEYVPD